MPVLERLLPRPPAPPPPRIVGDTDSIHSAIAEVLDEITAEMGLQST
jgi:hypothetical protein